MTEEEWLGGNAPGPMLEHLRGKASDRKLRLFACAVCRTFWAELGYRRCQQAIETAERYADGTATEQELSRAASLAGHAASDAMYRTTRGRLVLRDGITTEEVRARLVAAAVHVHQPFLIGRLQGFRGSLDFGRVGPELLREIFGNPFRTQLADPRWLTTDVLGLARGIYDDRAFDRLPVLADALIDAGCDDEAILAHCRSDGPHVRGCWVVDLVLGKG
jgi:hypothetical protein